MIRSWDVKVFSTALKRPFVTALGRKTDTCNVGLTLTLADGTKGYGEASASLALAHLTPADLAQRLKSLARAAVGRDAAQARALAERAWLRHGDAPPAAAAFECALLDAWTRSQGLTLAAYFGGACTEIETDITLSAWDPQATGRAAKEAAGEGFRRFKVKVRGDFAADFERLRIAATSCRAARLLIDGNQGLTLASALKLTEACLKQGWPVDLLEQPLPKTDWKGMAALTRRCPVPVAADEMVHSPQDALRVAGSRAASVINIKVAKSGLWRALEIMAIARAAGLKLMIGCMAETAEGLAPSVHLALGTGLFSFVDLDSDHLLIGRKARSWKRRGARLSLR